MYRTLFITFFTLLIGKLLRWFAITWLTVFAPLLLLLIVYIFDILVALTAITTVRKLLNEQNKQDHIHTTDQPDMKDWW